MRVVITGSHGLIGSLLNQTLKKEGYDVSCLVRRAPESPLTEYVWNPAGGVIDSKALEAKDAVIHLAGASIARRWSPAQKELIHKSRTESAFHLMNQIVRLTIPPRIFISASAVGYYGDRADEILTEESPMGHGFLPDVCQDWEAASQSTKIRNMRVIHLRFGLVLSPKGGALAKLLPWFKMYLGGKVGNGKQYVSWIALDDAVRVIQYAIETPGLEGPVNVVAPEPVTNTEFSETLGRVLGRPVWAPLPGFLIRMLYGQMGQELLLASTRALPEKLRQSGYIFQHPHLEDAFRHVLNIKKHKFSTPEK